MKLPYELIQNIINCLTLQDIINLSKVNKGLYSILNDEMYWKRKCFIDFAQIKKRKIYSWKELYIKFYQQRCIECFKKTKKINFFFNFRLCNACEKTFDKYRQINQKNALENYKLILKDIQHLPIYYKINPFFNRSINRIKLYLESDIQKIAVRKHGMLDVLKIEAAKKLTIEKSRKDRVEIIEKYLADKGITLSHIMHSINAYTSGMYNKLVANKVHINLDALLSYAQELDFVIRELGSNSCCSFEDFVIFWLSKNEAIPARYPEKIRNKILFIMTTSHKVQRLRKLQYLYRKFSLYLSIDSRKVYLFVFQGINFNFKKFLELKCV